MLPPKQPPSFIQLGRHGDLLILFPAFQEIARITGMIPNVLVTSPFHRLFDGISYARPFVVPGNWWEAMPIARRLARQFFGEDPIIPQWWLCTDEKNVPRGTQILQCHGTSWAVDVDKWPNFGISEWERTGLTRKEFMTLPLVFDRRDKAREAALVRNFYPPALRRKPLLLFNFTGTSSPFSFVPEVSRVMSAYRTAFHLVDLGQIRAQRLYDLLGLYDAAAGLITIDTATAHLANGSRVPTVWYTVEGWRTSVPRGNVALEIKYSDTLRRLAALNEVLKQWAATPTYANPSPHALLPVPA